ncbi:MAG: RNA methyltransferase [Thermomicrobiales bacterium]
MTPDDRAGIRHRGVGNADRLSLEPIRSQANPLIKDIRSLQQRRKRYQERAFVVEGARLVEDVFASGIEARHIVLREDVADRLLPTIPESSRLRVRIADEAVFASLSDVPHPQGILAVVPMLEASLERLDALAAPLVMVAAGVRDPGNLGTLFRSAAGAGVDHVFLADDSVDPYNPKVVRAAMGCHFRVSFSSIDTDGLANVLSSYHVTGLAEADGECAYDNVDWTGSSAIIVGGEAAGASDAVRELATVRVRIPLAHGVESLNAAVAGSLMVFEAARQRRATILA